MRNLLTAIILILFSLFSFGNEIDSLKTNADVESFIHKLSFWGKDSGMYDDETIQKLIINPGFYAHDTANQR
ncbi:MAG TPA: hypothetical protein VK890_00545, partial [Bacteroidia bacterium]|nr:hypothetical protein [Bacteroidia bacterium]